MPMRRLALVIYVAIALLAHGAVSMYADEAGKLDWHQENLGRFSSAGFDGRGGLTVLGEVRWLAEHRDTDVATPLSTLCLNPLVIDCILNVVMAFVLGSSLSILRRISRNHAQ